MHAHARALIARRFLLIHTPPSYFMAALYRGVVAIISALIMTVLFVLYSGDRFGVCRY
jgi:hypothetical protein